MLNMAPILKTFGQNLCAILRPTMVLFGFMGVILVAFLVAIGLLAFLGEGVAPWVPAQLFIGGLIVPDLAPLYFVAVIALSYASLATLEKSVSYKEGLRVLKSDTFYSLTRVDKRAKYLKQTISLSITVSFSYWRQLAKIAGVLPFSAFNPTDSSTPAELAGADPLLI